MVSNNKLERMGRRRFIKTAAALGVSASSLRYLSRDVISGAVEDLEEEVPYVARYRHSNHSEVRKGQSPEREAVWDTIPRTLWKRVESAHDAKDRLLDNVSRRFPSNLITVGVSSRSDQYEKQIEVKYTVLESDGGGLQEPSIDYSTLEQFVPSKAQGKVKWSEGDFQQEIPVRVTKIA
jgi:hypothetical protein